MILTLTNETIPFNAALNMATLSNPYRADHTHVARSISFAFHQIPEGRASPGLFFQTVYAPQHVLKHHFVNAVLHFPPILDHNLTADKTVYRQRSEKAMWIRRNCLTFAASVLAGASVFAEGKPLHVSYRPDLAGEVQRRTLAELDELLDYYMDLHAHPELSQQETRTAAKLSANLERLGYSVTTGVGGHGVVGVLDNGDGPTLMIRGDMDALPVEEETGLAYQSKVRATRGDGRAVGVMHACGHDIHQTCLVGTANILSQLRDKWRGRLMIVGQPAEEIGVGARAMIEDGLWQRFGKADYCIALHVSAGHPAGVVSYTPGWALANVDSVDITVYGRGGHGSRPHEAIDPVVMASQVVIALQTIISREVNPSDPAVITVGSFHAGSKHNIISNEAKLQITVRSYSDQTRKILLDGIRRVTINTCRALGAERDPDVTLRESEFTPSTYNDPALSEAAADIFRKVIGDHNVEKRDAVMGGEDFSRYSRTLHAPGFLFWLGSVPRERYEQSRKPGGTPLPSLHSSKYYPDPKPTITTGVRCMSSLALSILDKKS